MEKIKQVKGDGEGLRRGTVLHTVIGKVLQVVRTASAKALR